jgi:hypothetical protein
MKLLRIAALVALVLPACKGAPEAPDSIEEMMNFGFVYFEEDNDVMVDLADNLMPFVASHLEEAEEGWEVSSLSAEDLIAVGVEAPDVEDVIGAAASAAYVSDIDDVAMAITWPEKGEVFPHITEFDVVEATDLDCFLDHECDSYEFTVDQVVRASILGNASQTVTQQHRWIEHDDGYFFIMRTLSPDGIEFSSNLMRVFQQYSFAMVYTDGDGSRRMEAFWVDAEIIGLDVPEGFAVNQAIKQMHDSAELIDDFVESQDTR